ncbi:DUF3168 domain-containing protein [Rhodovulum marinum]|uniref:Uncharacterized protein DUF3168 n=1 Tax=Rhodovulum marinum TaxID=320662 RepID=A0A4R2Q7E4_9RHOB|nr:DUF3168 domain-containing protein [Rhodovulum marinum]TCP43934.1 uncharacterized protein DUF3168 [Rhodovulum marinum]
MDEFALQTALFERLSGDAALAGLGVTVCDAPAQGEDGDAAAAFPRVAIGEMDVRDVGTKGSDLFDVIVRVHTFSASGSHAEARAIQRRIFELLHRAAFAVPGHNLVMIRRERSTIDRDPDRLRHGLCEYRLLIEPL